MLLVVQWMELKVVIAAMGWQFRALYKTQIPQDLLTLTVNLTGSKTIPETNLWERLWGSFHFGVSEVRRSILIQRVENHRLWSLSLNKKGNRRNPAEHRIHLSLLPDCGCHVTSRLILLPQDPALPWPTVRADPASVTLILWGVLSQTDLVTAIRSLLDTHPTSSGGTISCLRSNRILRQYFCLYISLVHLFPFYYVATIVCFSI